MLLASNIKDCYEQYLQNWPLLLLLFSGDALIKFCWYAFYFEFEYESLFLYTLFPFA